MTILENLDMGAYARKDRKTLGEEMERVFELFPGCVSASRRPAARSPVASSRCSRSGAR